MQERDFERTMTITSMDGMGNAEEPPKLFGLPVKHGVTKWNLFAILLSPMLMMIISTYLNAQVVVMLADD